MRKPTFCICENKDTDQLCGNREADQRLCFHFIDLQSLYSLNPKERRAFSPVFGPLRDKIMKVTVQHFLVAVLLDE